MLRRGDAFKSLVGASRSDQGASPHNMAVSSGDEVRTDGAPPTLGTCLFRVRGNAVHKRGNFYTNITAAISEMHVARILT